MLWAFSFGLIKGELTSIAPSIVSALRLLLCALVFLPFLRFHTNNQLSIKLLLLGALQFGVMYWAYITSYQFLPGYLVAVFTIFTPMYVFLIDSVLSRRFNVQLLLPIFLSIIGAAVIVFKTPDSNAWLTGFFILQGANLAFAAGQVGYQRISNKYNNRHVSNMAIMYIGAAIFMGFIVLIEQSYEGLSNITQRQWLVILYLGIIASGLGFSLWNYGAKQVNTASLAIMNNAYIPFAVIFAFTLFNEQADIARLSFGSALILAAVWLLNKRQKQSN